MKRKRTLASVIFVAVVATLLLVPSISVAQAQKFIPVTFYVKGNLGPPTSLILAGDNQIITWKDDEACTGSFVGVYPYIGDIVGACKVERHWARHNVDVDAWTVERLNFTSTSATFMGITGGLTVLVTGSTTGGGRPDAVAGYTWRIISSSGELEGLHGQGTGTWLGGGKPIELVGDVHFGP
jgi:hypothetical protein